MPRSVFVLLCLVVVTVCRVGSPPSSLREQLARVRQAGAGVVIDLAQAVRGDWDTVVVLQPYTSDAQSDSVLGHAWRSRELSVVKSTDMYNLLVFLKDGRVRYAELLERSLGDFCCVEGTGRYAREDAEFVAVVEGGGFGLRWCGVRVVRGGIRWDSGPGRSVQRFCCDLVTGSA